jgi:predicted metalloprotease
VLYSGTTQSACGTASNQVGPFYCPLDQKVYIDASFFQILEEQFGSSGGPLAQEYVVAHEYGHALQDQLGLLGRAQEGGTGPESGSVKIELMADCLGGVWANNATTAKDPDTGTPFLKPLTTQDIQDALSAASAVGDDRIQQASQGRVTPESWTHGSAEARQRWFLKGFTTGDLDQCNTFTGAPVE